MMMTDRHNYTDDKWQETKSKKTTMCVKTRTYAKELEKRLRMTSYDTSFFAYIASYDDILVFGFVSHFFWSWAIVCHRLTILSASCPRADDMSCVFVWNTTTDNTNDERPTKVKDNMTDERRWEEAEKHSDFVRKKIIIFQTENWAIWNQNKSSELFDMNSERSLTFDVIGKMTSETYIHYQLT